MLMVCSPLYCAILKRYTVEVMTLKCSQYFEELEQDRRSFIRLLRVDVQPGIVSADTIYSGLMSRLWFLSRRLVVSSHYLRVQFNCVV